MRLACTYAYIHIRQGKHGLISLLLGRSDACRFTPIEQAKSCLYSIKYFCIFGYLFVYTTIIGSNLIAPFADSMDPINRPAATTSSACHDLRQQHLSSVRRNPHRRLVVTLWRHSPTARAHRPEMRFASKLVDNKLSGILNVHGLLVIKYCTHTTLP